MPKQVKVKPKASKTQTVYLGDEINDDTVGELIAVIMEVNEDPDCKALRILLNTPGGSISAGLALCDVMMTSQKPVDTVALGSCASMGVVILEAGAKRFITPNATLMIHKGAAGFSPDNADIVAKHLEQLSYNDKLADKIIARRVGMTLKEYRKFQGHTRYLNPKQALKHGFVDHIGTPL